jgi:hypothetical protein
MYQFKAYNPGAKRTWILTGRSSTKRFKKSRMLGSIGSVCGRFGRFADAILRGLPLSFRHGEPTTWSVHTLNPLKTLGPNAVLMATSAASRPRAMRTRPTRGVLCRASKVYQAPSR